MGEYMYSFSGRVLNSLMHKFIQRENEVVQRGFEWPFFRCRNGQDPRAAWAQRQESLSTSQDYQSLSVEDRKKQLQTLAHSMGISSAYDVGYIHRILQQPLPESGETESLRENLEKATYDALSYVCIDVNRLPPCRSKAKKAQLAIQLVLWVSVSPSLYTR